MIDTVYSGDTKRPFKSDSLDGIMEIISGNIVEHAFWVSNIGNSEASIENLDNVLYVRNNAIGLKKLLIRKEKEANLFRDAKVSTTTEDRERNFEADISFTTKEGKDRRISIDWPMNKNTEQILKLFLISNHHLDQNKKKTTKEIFEIFREESGLASPDGELLTGLKEWFGVAKKTGNFLLKSKHVDTFPKSKFVNWLQVHYFDRNEM